MATKGCQVAAVHKLVEEDARVTVLQIAEEVGISSGSVGIATYCMIALV